MIDTEHFDMDMIDVKADEETRYVSMDETCVLCGNRAMSGAMYCMDCAEKWLGGKA